MTLAVHDFTKAYISECILVDVAVECKKMLRCKNENLDIKLLEAFESMITKSSYTATELHVIH